MGLTLNLQPHLSAMHAWTEQTIVNMQTINCEMLNAATNGLSGLDNALQETLKSISTLKSKIDNEKEAIANHTSTTPKQEQLSQRDRWSSEIFKAKVVFAEAQLRNTVAETTMQLLEKQQSYPLAIGSDFANKEKAALETSKKTIQVFSEKVSQFLTNLKECQEALTSYEIVVGNGSPLRNVELSLDDLPSLSVFSYRGKTQQIPLRELRLPVLKFAVENTPLLRYKFCSLIDSSKKLLTEQAETQQVTYGHVLAKNLKKRIELLESSANSLDKDTQETVRDYFNNLSTVQKVMTTFINRISEISSWSYQMQTVFREWKIDVQIAEQLPGLTHRLTQVTQEYELMGDSLRSQIALLSNIQKLVLKIEPRFLDDLNEYLNGIQSSVNTDQNYDSSTALLSQIADPHFRREDNSWDQLDGAET